MTVKAYFLIFLFGSILNLSECCWPWGSGTTTNNNNNNNNNNGGGGGSSSSDGSGNNNNNNNNNREMNMANSLEALTLQAFSKCDTDGVSGLTWNEIESCEEEFCDMLSIECPTEDNFHAYDEDGDGNLTLQEYHDHIKNM